MSRSTFARMSHVTQNQPDGTPTWIDIEQVLTDEWEIGGLAMTTDAIRALVAGE